MSFPCDRDASAYYGGPCVRGRVYLEFCESEMDTALYGPICKDCLKKQAMSKELEAARAAFRRPNLDIKKEA
jgi:hypothetical protein